MTEEAEPFHCIGCGKDYIGERMQCDCATGIGYRRGERTQIVAEQRRTVTLPFDEYQAIKRTQPPLPEAPGDVEAMRVEQLAQWLHDEGGFGESYSGRSWPEHPDDTGQRDGGYVKLVPSDAQAKFRDVARRCLARFPGSLPLPKTKEEGEAVTAVDAFEMAMCSRALYGPTVRRGRTAAPLVACCSWMFFPR